ncbi:bifunctional riboflavin kinase/FAD synthetase [Heyndrickxia sp. NPDC080065]|uniref:bifunctional riboflavin kinase/FAD synthetase n=1 Tax=Heyndrickxia sp. NPDC080065 TaxID=3390568 RepID=UPI003CFF3016
MKVITIHHPHTFKSEEFPPLVIALGYFDGIHLGHQKVISSARQIADQKKWKSAVMTFDPHPSVVLSQNHKQIELITPLEEKKNLVEAMGIDYLFVVRFTSSFANLSPEEYVDQYLIGLNVHHVVAGFDFTFGKFGKGTMETLPIYSKGKFTCSTVEKLAINREEGEEKVSSTLTRQLLNNGDMKEVRRVLGRYYRTKGIVIHGEKRGRQIGFPTANIKLNSDYIIPKPGVYAVKIKVNGTWFNGVCNVGFKPTFKMKEDYSLTIEVHIINFDDSIYGEEVSIEWHLRIRDEKKFDGIDQLKQQIAKDTEETINYFENIVE